MERQNGTGAAQPRQKSVEIGSGKELAFPGRPQHPMSAGTSGV